MEILEAPRTGASNPTDEPFAMEGAIAIPLGATRGPSTAKAAAAVLAGTCGVADALLAPPITNVFCDPSKRIANNRRANASSRVIDLRYSVMIRLCCNCWVSRRPHASKHWCGERPAICHQSLEMCGISQTQTSAAFVYRCISCLSESSFCQAQRILTQQFLLRSITPYLRI